MKRPPLTSSINKPHDTHPLRYFVLKSPICMTGAYDEKATIYSEHKFLEEAIEAVGTQPDRFIVSSWEWPCLLLYPQLMDRTACESAYLTWLRYSTKHLPDYWAALAKDDPEEDKT